MNLKNVLILTICLGCFCIPVLLSNVCTAQEATISIVDFRSTLISQTTVGARQNRVYSFVLFLHNNGSVASEDLHARFSDPELIGANLTFFTTADGNISNFTINPGETKAVYYTEWPTMVQGGFSINVSYGPTSPQSVLTPFNSGYHIYTIAGDTATKKSTPGFEIAFVLLAIVVLLSGRIRKK
jgi:hypothetical protein